MIEKISEKLMKYDYKFSKVENKLIVKLDFSQEVSITFTDDGKYIIKDRFNNWNFLTGMLKFSLKNTMIYNTIGLVLAFLFYIYLEKTTSDFNYMIIFVVGIALIILWTIYFLIKAEGFKKQIIEWIENQ